jgi:hypothetical protein
MVDQLCQAYHWPFDKAMKMTMPQIIMLNHASWVNGKRYETDKETEESGSKFNGKRVEEMNTDEWGKYYGFAEAF